MPFAASIGDPPPTATRTALPAAARNPATASAPAARSPVVGLGWTPLNRLTGIPAADSTPVTAATTGVAASPASVITTAAWLPVPRTMPGSLPTAPAPKCAAGVGVMAIFAAAMAERIGTPWRPRRWQHLRGGDGRIGGRRALAVAAGAGFRLAAGSGRRRVQAGARFRPAAVAADAGFRLAAGLAGAGSR